MLEYKGYAGDSLRRNDVCKSSKRVLHTVLTAMIELSGTNFHADCHMPRRRTVTSGIKRDVPNFAIALYISKGATEAWHSKTVAPTPDSP